MGPLLFVVGITQGQSTLRERQLVTVAGMNQRRYLVISMRRRQVMMMMMMLPVRGDGEAPQRLVCYSISGFSG